MKISIFLTELASVLLTPFILWYSLPPCAERIVDFFREFTWHVDGLGYVCSSAVFDLKRHGHADIPEEGSSGDGARRGRGVGVRGREVKRGEGKMEKSFLNFKVRFNPLPRVLCRTYSCPLSLSTPRPHILHT